MSRFVLIVLLIAAMALVPRTALSAPDVVPAVVGQTDIDAQQVKQAIEKGVEYLERVEDLSNDSQFGHWPDYRDYVGSTTCLCTMALLYAGVPASDPHVAKALNYLRTLTLNKTYTVSLQTMVFCLAEPKRDLLLIQRNAKWLEETQIHEGPHRGGWAYPGMGNGDNSNSQFALLAFTKPNGRACRCTIKPGRWRSNYWKSAQNFDGSFGYYNLAGKVETPGSGSMTCAGIASLVIASGRISAGDAQADGDQIHCCGNQQGDDSAERVERALRWLGRPDVFTVQQNPRGSQSLWHFYFLYGVERIGRLTARRFIGDHDWYREGAALLCSPGEQQLGGQWQGSGSSVDPEHDPNIATSFALLFLTKGRRPILISKLQHGPGDDWNHHRSDVANLTSYVETRWTKEFPLGMSWQVVDLSKATVEDLQQSPVLYLCGSQAPDIDDHQGQVLRDYIDRGGFLFAEACCDGDGFDRGFRALVKKIFPPEYQLEGAAAGASDLACRRNRAGRTAADAARHRLRLPHERGLLPAAEAGRSAGRLVVFVGTFVGPRAAVPAVGGGANRGGQFDRHQRAGLRHQSRIENEGSKLQSRARKERRKTISRATSCISRNCGIRAAAIRLPRRCRICWKRPRANCKSASAPSSD